MNFADWLDVKEHPPRDLGIYAVLCRSEDGDTVIPVALRLKAPKGRWRTVFDRYSSLHEAVAYRSPMVFASGDAARAWARDHDPRR